jgi:hypothetical protein
MSGLNYRLAPGHAQAVTDFFESDSFKPVTPITSDGKAIVLDLSRGSTDLGESLVNIDVDRFSRLVDTAMTNAGTVFAFGRYAEDRELYNNENFDNDDSPESRSIHMGIDLFCDAGTAVVAPLEGSIAVIANNTAELDYGPMLILRHSAGKHSFYSLYGHLDLASIAARQIGQKIAAGEQIAAVGNPPQNGNWPPHLHFQLILDLLGLGKDFPGVAYPDDADFWLTASPSPACFFSEIAAARLNCA